VGVVERRVLRGLWRRLVGVGNRAGVLRGSGLYNACIVGRVVLGHHPPTRPKRCPLEALRWGVGGETMTTPGGAGTPYKSCHVSPRARRTSFSHRVGALWSTLLRPFAFAPVLCRRVFLMYRLAGS
jgi:hypothetical protein